MERCKKLGHEVETCVVVEHLPRLSASQNRNGVTEENGDTSPEKKTFNNKVAIEYSFQINPKFIHLIQGCPIQIIEGSHCILGTYLQTAL
jgi:hypothetical protein